jgi:hypothetical protein
MESSQDGSYRIERRRHFMDDRAQTSFFPGAAARLLLAVMTITAAACQNVPVSDVLQTSTAALDTRRECMSTSECSDGEHCSVDDGDCQPRSSCGIDGSYCYDVCAGTCVVNDQPWPRIDECRSDAECFAWAGCDNCGECTAFFAYGPFPACMAPEDDAICWDGDCDAQEAFCNAGQCALRPRSSDR